MIFTYFEAFVEGKKFNSIPNVQNELSIFLKNQSFYSNGIKKLPVRWREIIDSGGKYIIDSHTKLC